MNETVDKGNKGGVECPSCGRSMPIGSAKCPSCNAEIEAEYECPKCSSPISEGSPKCPKCGELFRSGVADVVSRGAAIRREVAKAIIGKEMVLTMVEVVILSDGHLLFEDFPGLAKSLMAMTFSDVLGMKFKRIQFTPDLLPSDITGTYIYDESENEFKFRPGPIFANLVLADEINRAPPKAQAAMLEAMQEKQVSIEGVTHKLPRPFIVLATQNPIEQEGTYPLPEAQMDRFLMKMSVGYPDRDIEIEILARRIERKKDDVDVNVMSNPEIILNMQKTCETVYVSKAIQKYIVEIVSRTREDSRIQVGSSPRGSLALLKLSRAYAALLGRDYVIPDDIKIVAIDGLKHRMVLKPQVKVKGIKPEEIIAQLLEEVPVPTV